MTAHAGSGSVASLAMLGVTPLPSDLLEAIGVDSDVLGIIVNALALIGAIAAGVAAIWKACRAIRQKLTRRNKAKADPRRHQRRSAFASFVESQVRDLDNKEEWSDQRFAELEAEVETVGTSSPDRRFLGLVQRRPGLRREKSLSRALQQSRETLILLQGDPGSGKSVALRFVARKMATKAIHAKDLDAVIPLYVNLKALHPAERPVTAQHIEDFVLGHLKEGSNRDIDRFLDKEFSPGKLAGTWFFLFDSFDEIPDVLSATEVDETVREYSKAIFDFVHAMSTCRGVIASRHFRAPPSYGLPTFRIVPLSEKRKIELIHKADLGDAEAQLLIELPAATPDVIALSANPLFLGLLCEYARGQDKLPTGWHDVFEAYVSRRISTDRLKLEQLFSIGDQELRHLSEEIAFTMTATVGLGLSPSRSDLERAYETQGFAARDRLSLAMDALQWIKLARAEPGGAVPTDPTFTFAHRRFQEYFATCVVLREPTRVPAHALLTDASWRETAVTLCQSRPADAKAIVEEAQQLLELTAAGSANGSGGAFEWPPRVLHILSLLQSAFAGRGNALPAALRDAVATILCDASRRGTVRDRKWVLEVAGTAPSEVRAELLREAFTGKSAWLRDVAYRQVARLSEIDEDLATEIRRTLIARAASRQLGHDWPATRAQLLRLDRKESFLSAAQLLRWIPYIDVGVHIAGVVALTVTDSESSPDRMVWLAIAAAISLLSYYPVAAMAATWPRVGLIGGFAAEVRLMVAIAGVWVSITGGVPGIAVTAVWLYAATWAPAAVYAVLRNPPRSPLGWPFVHLQILSRLFSQLRRVTASGVAIALVVAAAWAAVVAGVIWLATSVDMLSIVLAILTGAVGVWYFGSRLIQTIKTEGSDWRWCRRWSRAEEPELTAQDLLTAMAALRSGPGAVRFLREVRVRRLLEKQPDAELVVRDLLRGIDLADGAVSPGTEAWRSEAFAAWATQNGRIELQHLSRFAIGVPDELGQLLEDLEHHEELPVA